MHNISNITEVIRETVFMYIAVYMYILQQK